MEKCKWATQNEIMETYHDTQWGKIHKDEILIFEMLCLEGQQSGLSWNTILSKREGYREAFCNFIPEEIAKFDQEKVKELMNNKDIIRYDKKIESIINNAKVYLKMKENNEKLYDFFWSYVDGQIINSNESNEDVLSKSPLSEKISKDLKNKGFSYVGPVTVYSLLQSIGVINDHINQCVSKF
ncbi:MAG: DNA-3-methyladenine glycosylase I [Lachnospirales bacterium]